MIRKFLIAAAAALVLGGCATGYGYSGHGNSGYDAYGDYYYGGSSYGYGGYGGYGYGAPYGLGAGIGYYGGYGRYYGGYGSPWYGGSSWYGWPGYGYYPPYRPPHHGHGRPDRPDPPSTGIPSRPSQSQARPHIRDGWESRPGRTITPSGGRLRAPAPADRAPSRARERPLQRGPRPTSMMAPESRLRAPGADSGGARLRSPVVQQQRPGARMQPAERAVPSQARLQRPVVGAAPDRRLQPPARVAMPRQVERSGTPASRPAVRAPARSAAGRRSTREVLTETP